MSVRNKSFFESVQGKPGENRSCPGGEDFSAGYLNGNCVCLVETRLPPSGEKPIIESRRNSTRRE